MRITKPGVKKHFRIRAGISLLAATAVGLGTAGMAHALPAPAAPAVPMGTAQLTASAPIEAADGSMSIDVTGTNYATTTPSGTNFGGAYIFFGVVTPKDPADPDSWGPSKGGQTNINYAYNSDMEYQSMVSYPGNTTTPGYPMMDAQGNWTANLPITGPTFTDAGGTAHDCFVEQCGVITIGAHGQKNGAVEAFAPVNFVKKVAPTITTQPADVSVEEGSDATFTVVAEGEPAPTYQWERSNDNGATWTPVDGATEASYTLAAAAATDSNALFRVVVTNSEGAVTSNAGKLVVTEKPVAALTVELAKQQSAAHPLYFTKDTATLEVTVSDPAIAGLVTIYDEKNNLGSAEVVDGKAEVPVTFSLWGGARYLHASFKPTDSITYPDPVVSEKVLYQIVDLVPEVNTPDVNPDNPAAVQEGEMTWTWGNYYLSFFKSGFVKEAVGANVSLGDAGDGSGLAAANREIIFSNGTGVEDADGTVQVDFTGEAKVRSGKDAVWHFVDPQITIDAEGYGTLTAVFTSDMGDAAWQGERRYIATFDEYGTTITDNGDGTKTLVADPIWEDQTYAGTWALEHSASYPADMLSAMDAGVRGFWYESGAGADPSKKPLPLTLTYKVAQKLTVAEQPTSNHPEDLVGKTRTLTAALKPAHGEGVIEFFDNGVSLGTADTVNGEASFDVTWSKGGKHDITATFTPAGESTPTLESPATLYRVVDPAWRVDQVTLGADQEALDPAQTNFTWTFGNYYLEFFQSGFTKFAEGANVKLYPADTATGVENPPIGDQSTDTNSEFQFTNGVGYKDAAGNVSVDFTGVARVMSGDSLGWEFKDPQVRIAADGSGYVTAEFTDSWADPEYKGKRVLIGEFTSSEGPLLQTAAATRQAAPAAAGDVERYYMQPWYADHTAPGTWGADFTGGYPNEMLVAIADDGRAFWYETGSSSDGFKPPHQMMLNYAVTVTEPEPDPVPPVPDPDPDPVPPVPDPDPDPVPPVPDPDPVPPVPDPDPDPVPPVPDPDPVPPVPDPDPDPVPPVPDPDPVPPVPDPDPDPVPPVPDPDPVPPVPDPDPDPVPPVPDPDPVPPVPDPDPDPVPPTPDPDPAPPSPAPVKPVPTDPPVQPAPPVNPPVKQPSLPVTGAETTSLALLMLGMAGAGTLVVRRKYAR